MRAVLLPLLELDMSLIPELGLLPVGFVGCIFLTAALDLNSEIGWEGGWGRGIDEEAQQERGFGSLRVHFELSEGAAHIKHVFRELNLDGFELTTGIVAAYAFVKVRLRLTKRQKPTGIIEDSSQENSSRLCPSRFIARMCYDLIDRNHEQANVTEPCCTICNSTILTLCSVCFFTAKVC